MECAYCGKKIGVLRKLQHAEFCSDAHEKAYKKKQEALALDFLMQNKQRRAPEVPPVETPLAATPPVESRPLPPVAGFVAEHAAPARLDASLERIAQPRRGPHDPVLPAFTGLGSSALRVSGFVVLTAAADFSPVRTPATGRGEFPFASDRPRIRSASIGPQWIAAKRQAPAERTHAGFAGLAPKWTPPEPGEVRGATVIRSTFTPSMAGAALTPRSPALGPAVAVRCSIETNRRPAPPMASTGIALNRACKPMFEPRAPLTLLKSGIACSEQVAVPEPRSKPAPPAAVRSAAGRPMLLASPELRSAVNLGARRRSPACAGPAAIASPRNAPATTPAAIATAPFAWKYQIRLGPYRRVGAIRPNFEAPAAEDPRCEDPIRRLEPVVRVRWAARLANVSHRMPAWSRRLAVLALIAVMVWVGAARVRHSAAAKSAQDEMWARISRRAAVGIQDDFRSGLSQWTGGPDWAKSWSYDGTGFARPGRLALLSGSLPLSDYRLDFAVQIERKAVCWVFRAADRNNYYATKLVESKRGAASIFSIVRYAVIDGRERFKAELPLPVTASARTMLHVRQEIRGAQFTTYLDGAIIDTWSDSSLTAGGVGFFADAGESAYIRSIDVAQNDDTLGRLCSYLTLVHGR
jgi:hypothetical protein